MGIILGVYRDNGEEREKTTIIGFRVGVIWG